MCLPCTVWILQRAFSVCGIGAKCRTAESSDKESYVIKNMIPGEFEYQLNLQQQLSAFPNVRSVVDTVPDLNLFIYPFLAGDLLHIKANNILVDYDESIQGQTIINNVQISDLEDAVLVPPGKWLRGPLCGNAIWRSPESWCRSRQNQASDVFSFAIVCLQMIYVMLNKMVFRVSDCELYASDSWRYVLRRHISYFADEQGLNGLLKHIGEDNPFYGQLIALTGDFNSGNPRMPFEAWEYVDPEFRDLVGKMTNLDPTRRITARQALEHSWFSQAI
ncbi:conserved hypothetical protein [Histoplasma capsulatum G186AR]|uniref:Protein kinase domain-containing protein n=1 Tax=Ajellomyces capsulatus (strain G186AR / H82 / ATCC MYA-2454 / RMSCC 2432) TaxID=447093 RepID=C0NDM6_AJECG|nr:uncharacterized protein HCBG_01969 [Histoplasma capsulatum G186AR]EEH10324.1 conserved hypothetical protein [Histoplasma capsulatum G186AR]